MNPSLSFLEPDKAAARIGLSKAALTARLNRVRKAKDGTYPLMPGVVGVKIGSHWRVRFEEPSTTAPAPAPKVAPKKSDSSVLVQRAVDLAAVKELLRVMEDLKQPQAARDFARHLLTEAERELRKTANVVRKRLSAGRPA